MAGNSDESDDDKTLAREDEMSDPMKPSPELLSLLGSALIHAEEAMSPNGHELDRHTFEHQMKDLLVVEWIKEMNALAMLPVKR